VGESGIQAIIAAVILGVCILAGAYMIAGSLDRGATTIPMLEVAINDMKVELAKAAAASPAAAAKPAAQRRRGPDPARVYNVKAGDSPSKGGSVEAAKVTVVEFSDFQCPFCSRVTPTLAQIDKTYGSDVRVVFKHLPLAFHAKAPAAPAAAEAAHQQGKFWEMHDKIFANQGGMSEEKYLVYAQEIGLELERFKEDVSSAKVKQRIEADKRQAGALGVTGTPGFFINGRFVAGAKPFSEFKKMIDAALAKAG
jgi:protein-disulfide isomerase